jgi:DNA modification methylase
MTGLATVLRGDARRLPLTDDSVDLVISSPPYFALRSYQDGGEHYAGQIGSEATPAEFVDALVEVTRECVRVLKPSGSLWINLGDKYSGAQAQNFNGTAHAGASADVWRRTDPRRTGIPNKSLMGIPWRYALRCIDTTRTGHLHTAAVREVIDDLATGVIDQRTAHRRIDTLEEQAAKGSAGLGLILRAEIIWSKPNGLPESVTDRVRRSHEQWFHFTLEPRYYSAVDEIREPQVSITTATGAVRYRRPGEQLLPQVRNYTDASKGNPARVDGGAPSYAANNPLGKLPGSVWTIPTEPLTVPDHLGVDHFAAFPTEWPRRIIQGWSPPGGLILDPFGGTGTSALVAKALGRHGITIDMSADYSRLARWRTTDQRQLAGAMRIPKPPVQVDGQASMFEFLEEA